MKEKPSDALEKTVRDRQLLTSRRAVSRKALIGIAVGVLLIFAIAYAIWGDAGYGPVTATPIVDVPGVHADLLDALNRARTKLDRMPRSAEAWGNYGMLLMQNERPKEALTCFDEAIRYNDTDPKWYYFAGIILEQTDLTRALSYLASCHERKPDYVPLMLRICTIRVTLGQFDQAQKMLEHIRVTSPETTETWVQLVRLERLQGHPCNAARWLTEARSLNAVSAVLLRECAIAELQCGHADQARLLSTEAETVVTSSALHDTWLEELRSFDFSGNVASSNADVLRQHGQLGEAASTLASLARRFPERSRPALNLALLLRDQGRLEEAVRSLSSLVAQFPDDPLLRFHLAVLLAQSGSRPDDVIAALHDALRLKPDYATARAALADVLGSQGKHDEALVNYARAVQDSPGDPWIRFGFASALIAQGQKSDAELQLEQLARLLKAEQTEEQLELKKLRQRVSAIQLDVEKSESVENP